MVLLLAAWLSSCATNPVSGLPELMLISEDQEMRMGLETDKQVASQFDIYDDPTLTAYAGDMCRRLGRLSHRTDLSYHFKILDTPAVNAFAAPGGYVYFTRGILASLSSEAEMAGIMGHELGHISARHSAQQYSRAQLAQVGLGIGMIIGGPARYLAGVAELGVGVLFLKFSRDNEREADRLGVEYSSKGGYDAREMARFFETLERMNPGSDRSGLPGWFSTHPSPEDREGAVRTEAAAWREKLNLTEPVSGRDAYLQRIDGLIYGENPREGFVEDNTFYHPELRFQFPVPVGWKVRNTRRLVQMVSAQEDAAVLFSINSASSPEGAAETFVRETKTVVLEAGKTRVNGSPAYAVTSRVRTQRGALQLLSYFILWEGRVYEFHGFTPPDRFAGYRPAFERTMAGFGSLSDPKRLNVRPERIRVRTAGTAGPLEAALRKQGVADEELERLAVLNGMHLNDWVRPETLIKLVERGK
jgi:predicted Zn-dependent protease